MDRTRRIAELFDLLIELKPDLRAAQLDLHCPDDPSLRQEVERLLAAHEVPTAGPGITDKLLRDSAEAISDAAMDARIGPYRVIRRLGEGGLGYVVLAFRETDSFQKRFAIKLIKRGMDTEEILRRFDQERQVLASLNHPNIAHVFDAGTTEDGRPYFVMEYIEGVPIDQFCDEHALSTHERVKLFTRVCAAVHYAHQNLVIHRDIKPGNILVTPDGEPRLLDFGIAKLLNPDMLGSPVTTGPELRLMTPEYASPEQVEGRPITTASDVYSLGVLLYHLLTGRPPYELRSRVRDEVARIICEVEPARPSTAVSKAHEYESADGVIHRVPPENIARTRDGQVKKLRRRLSGDLDNIILMALRKAPKRRYASVEQFADDCLRHLQGRTVAAHPPSRWYALSVFIRRNAIGSAAAAAALLAIVTLGIVSTVQAVKLDARGRTLSDALSLAEKQKDVAEQESKVRTETATLAIGVIKEVGRIGKVRPSIPSALLASLIEGWLSRSELAGRPELSLQLHTVVADVLAATRQDERALSHAQEALNLGERVYGLSDPRLARLYTRLARSLSRLERHDESIARANQAVEVTRASAGDLEALNARWRLALSLHAAGRVEESRAIAEEVLIGSDSAHSTLARVNARLYASEHASLAGDHARAERLANDALGVLQDAGIDGRPIATVVRIQLGTVMVRAGKLREGEGELEQSVAEGVGTIATVHAVTYEAMRRHAEVLHLMGRYAQAATLLQRCEAFRVQQDGMRHARSAWLWLRISANHFAAGDEAAGSRFLAMAVSRGINRNPEDIGWLADFKHAKEVLKAGDWKLDATLAKRLGHLSWMVAPDAPTPADTEDIDAEP